MFHKLRIRPFSSFPSAEAAGGMPADFADLVGKLHALLGKLFSDAMF